jgi:predicted PurR-regulated permease PerM
MPPRIAVKKLDLSFERIRTLFFVTLLIVLGIAVFYLFRPFFYPIFWAAVFASVFHPLYRYLHHHLKHSGIASALSVGAVVLTILIPLTIVGVLLIVQSIELFERVTTSGYTLSPEHIGASLKGTIFGPYLEHIQTLSLTQAESMTKAVSLFIFDNLKTITGNSLRVLLMMAIMLYTLFYFFKDGHRMLRRTMHLSPLGDKYEVLLLQKFTSTASATLRGTVIIGFIQGILAGIGFWIAGIEGLVVWTVLTILFAIIPAVGPIVVWLPVAIVELAMGRTWQGITIILIGSCIVGVIDNILRPILVGKDTQMHPLIVLFSTLGGILLFGFSGFVIGPVTAALFLAVISMYDIYFSEKLNQNI